MTPLVLSPVDESASLATQVRQLKSQVFQLKEQLEMVLEALDKEKTKEISEVKKDLNKNVEEKFDTLTITANKIDLNGAVTANGHFTIDLNGIASFNFGDTYARLADYGGAGAVFEVANDTAGLIQLSPIGLEHFLNGFKRSLLLNEWWANQLTVGNETDNLSLVGASDRPSYNNEEIALVSDLLDINQRLDALENK